MGEADETDLSAEAPEVRFRDQLKKAKWCTVCKDVFKHGAGHRSRQGIDHKTVKLSDEQGKQLFAELMAEGADKKRLVAQRRQQAKDEWKADAGEECSTREYTLDFGKHQTLTIARVMRKYPDYLKVLVSMGTHHSRPDFKQALEDANLLGALVEEGRAHRMERATKTVARGPPPEDAHRDVKKLKALQLAEAEALVAADGAAESMEAAPEAENIPKKRRHVSRSVVQSHDCGHCGGMDHVASTCPTRKALAGRFSKGQLVAAAYLNNKKKGKLVSRLKYTSILQRSEGYDCRPSKRARGLTSLSFLELARMSAIGLTGVLIDSGLLRKMSGCRCPHCQGTIGKLAHRRQSEDYDIDGQSVFYRCQHCRKRCHVAEGSKLFDGLRGGKGCGVTTATLAFFNCCNGVSLTSTCCQLRINEKTCAKYYERAMQIMSSDIIAKQGDMVFGQLPDRMTADVEADESSFSHWSDGKDHFWYPWIGVVQRGSTTKLWIQPLGITQSTGEPRVPPLGEDAWEKVCQSVFTASSGVNLMTDGAQAYRNPKHPGVVRHEWVNHSAKEFARSVDVPKFIDGSGMRSGMAGTQVIDRMWGLLKKQIPPGIGVRQKDGTVSTAWLDL